MAIHVQELSTTAVEFFSNPFFKKRIQNKKQPKSSNSVFTNRHIVL